MARDAAIGACRQLRSRSIFSALPDPAARDQSTYQDPLRYSEGFAYVAVNGELVVDGGEITKARPGRALRGPGWRGQ